MTIDESLYVVAGLQLKALIARPDGDPRAVILALHGGSYDHRYYHHRRDSFLELGAKLGITVVAPDRPGYGSSQDATSEQTTFSGSADVLRELAQVVWAEEGSGCAGLLLVGHSVGGMLALEAAAGLNGLPLLGVEGAGLGMLWQPGLQGMWASLITDDDVLIIPPDAHRHAMYGPEGTFDPAVRDEQLLISQPVPMSEMRDVVKWPERMPKVVSSLQVPIQLTLSEYDVIWQSGPEAIHALTNVLPTTGENEVVHLRHVGHSIASHWAARAYHLSVLAFAERCILRTLHGPAVEGSVTH